MPRERRYALTAIEGPTNDPGLTQDAVTGISYQVDSSGTRTPLGGGGGSLPSWWTVDSTPGSESVEFAGTTVIAPIDITKALLTLRAPAGFYDSGYYQSFELEDEAGNIVTTFSVDGDIDVLQQAGHGGGAGWQIRSVDFPQNRLHFDARELILTKAPGNQLFMYLANLDGSDTPTGDMFSVDERLRLRMSNVAGAPADVDIPAGVFFLWPDATNGAAKLRLKGKSADGTVVVGEVALT